MKESATVAQESRKTMNIQQKVKSCPSKRKNNQIQANSQPASLVWTNKKGASCPIADLSTGHLVAIFKMYIRNYPRYSKITNMPICTDTTTKEQIVNFLHTMGKFRLITNTLSERGVRQIDGYRTQL